MTLKLSKHILDSEKKTEVAINELATWLYENSAAFDEPGTVSTQSARALAERMIEEASREKHPSR
ncbi:hypothetical protein CC53_gp115 [Rhizobium phage vB_RleS_L338C]|uniref:hypothetical protein n=1 Tax=Rhizobium phage vB_RleS_L338C TaxID=1414737 RepID=UPI0003D7E1A7|nr:hypothetical protein CC53_gp115 [Rhizobium phage vB_RleS_L338C]AHC30532.1 hypothetical protein L338C_115 [Rhizobium phage vB_RleS_L338C]QNH72183.1 hypothetical protein P11VFA_035 [Rhizobium phage P11VFA]